jgi:hypothetical protein
MIGTTPDEIEDMLGAQMGRVFVDVDAAGLDAGQLFEIGDDRPQRLTVERPAA